ncbi:RE114 protein, partial [Eolophus roseicapillus]|nr:RE114 protein [Eolophus roseicapilla]
AACCGAPPPLRAGMAVAGGGHGSEPGQGSTLGDTSLLSSATTWPLKRYGRFLPPTDRDDEGQNAASWKVFESNEESGHLILTVVVSGHFFISQGRTVLEGFSLIDSHKWLKIVRKADCLLLHAQAKNEGRMFRVQFGGDSKEEMLENCWSCVQKLAEYVPVQGTEEQSQQLYPSLSQLAYGDSQVRDAELNASLLQVPDEPLPDSCASLGERRSVPQLAQSVLNKKLELPPAPWHPVWGTQELGPFIRFCLLDQHFPAFVQAVEKELQKLTED